MTDNFKSMEAYLQSQKRSHKFYLDHMHISKKVVDGINPLKRVTDMLKHFEKFDKFLYNMRCYL